MNNLVWERWFAWRPVKTNDLRWVWLQRIERAFDPDIGWWGDASGHAGTDGGWVYRTEHGLKGQQ
jgi:hypothetical protein